MTISTQRVSLFVTPFVTSFTHPTFGTLRVVMRDGEPWFVAADVCKALELEQVSNAMRKLDSDEGGLFEIPHPQNPTKTMAVRIVSEAGLYTLVLSSRKPEAKAFKRWVTHDILPSIRKHGAYMTPAKVEEMQKSTKGSQAHIYINIKLLSYNFTCAEVLYFLFAQNQPVEELAFFLGFSPRVRAQKRTGGLFSLHIAMVYCQHRPR